MQFPGFIGNEAVKEQLRRAFLARRLPHAIVFQGEAGTGKRTLASLLAKALVCEDAAQAPCGQCPACIRAAAGSHPDIRVETGSGASGSITVDTVRQITADAYRMPEEAPVSVYLLFPQARLSEAVQNKLLKLIEEPPDNTVFLFTCSRAQDLLPTIRSRVQLFSLLPPTPDLAAAHYAKLQGVPLSQAEALAAQCGGNLGKMLAESDAALAGQALSTAQAMLDTLLSADEHTFLAAAAPMIKDRQLFQDVLQRLHLAFRDACTLRAGGIVRIGGMEPAVDKLCKLSRRRLMALLTLPPIYGRRLERNANMALLVTAFCAQLRAAVAGEPMDLPE